MRSVCPRASPVICPLNVSVKVPDGCAVLVLSRCDARTFEWTKQRASSAHTASLAIKECRIKWIRMIWLLPCQIQVLPHFCLPNGNLLIVNIPGGYLHAARISHKRAGSGVDNQ